MRDVAKVVAEAVALTGADKHLEPQATYDEAFEFYQWLLKFYSQTQGLQTAVQDYRYLNAGVLFRAQRAEEAFAILEELYRQNREYRYQGGAQTALAATVHQPRHLAPWRANRSRDDSLRCAAGSLPRMCQRRTRPR